MPAACSLRIWAVASASISSGSQAAQQGERAKLADALAKVRIAGGTAAVQQTVGPASGASRGVPSTRTMWHPTPSRGVACARRNRFLKCLAVGHQRRRSHDAVFVGLHDGAIHARRSDQNRQR